MTSKKFFLRVAEILYMISGIKDVGKERKNESNIPDIEYAGYKYRQTD